MSNEFKHDDVVSYLTLDKKEIRKGAKHTRTYWKCKCICDKIVYRRDDFLCKKNIVQSCGCMHPQKMAIGPENANWKGYGQVSGYYLASIRSGAKKRNIIFDITVQEISDLFEKQERKYALTNLLLVTNPSNRRKEVIQTASLDRIDANKGYTIDNVQWVHSKINKMKNNIPEQEFIEFCKLVAQKAQKI